jgi:uncharacterized protein (TIGR00369 family)
VETRRDFSTQDPGFRRDDDSVNRLHRDVVHVPLADLPGWYSWDLPDNGRFHQAVGRLIVRPEGEGRGRCRIQVEESHLNLGGAMHGGAILAFVDMALYVAGFAAGADTADAVTLDCNVQFVAPARAGASLDAELELIRETRRLAFFRGLVVQEGVTIAAFGATLRKGRPAS